ncbi:MAG: class I SAM-dependent methyltransferase [Candidatus Saccharimonadales bacterium]
MKLSHLVKKALATRLPGRARHCVLCSHHPRYFLPYRQGTKSALMGTLDMIGSDIRNFECPYCGSHDRERHLFLYMQAMKLLEGMRNKSVLHVAPEKVLSGHIANAKPLHYVRCDLYPQTIGIMRIDILQMEFDSESFDVIIANHVLEHVADDTRALHEIRRVLKKDGYAILQTPYSQKLQNTWQDSGITDKQARFQAYGQEDHVRLYGSDIFNRFASAGFKPDIRTHSALLPDIDAHLFGVNPREPMFLFYRAD